MSQGNVDRFISATDAFNRSDVEAFLEFIDPEVRYEPIQAALQGAYMGHDGVREWFADVTEHYAAERWEVSYAEVLDLGDDILGVGTLRFTAKRSGINTETAVAFLATFEDGRMVRFKDYGARETALKAAGVEG